MARMARLVVPNYPHHVTQRGNRRQRTFFSEGDYQTYLKILANAKRKASLEVWAYCLMPNHVHFVVVPSSADGLSTFFGDAHRRYTRHVNKREGWCGHLWQERFHSFVMDEQYLLAAVRYTELNPVQAGLCDRPEMWKWSSVHAHLSGRDDNLVTVDPMLRRIDDWSSYLDAGALTPQIDDIRKHTSSGRPIGDENFLTDLENITGRRLRKARPGRKPNK